MSSDNVQSRLDSTRSKLWRDSTLQRGSKKKTTKDERAKSCQIPWKPDLTVMNEKQKRVLLADPSSVGSSVRVVRLPHPRTRLSAPFLCSESGSVLSELVCCEEKHRSWFLDDLVLSRGQLYIAVPVDPLLLLLPFLLESKVLRPLDQIVAKEAVLATLANEKDVRARLQLVADSKGDQALNVWMYSEEKTLTFLSKKVLDVAQVIESEDIRVDGGASASNFVNSKSLEDQQAEKDNRLRYAWGIVSEYLTPDLSSSLRGFMNIPSASKTIKCESSPPCKRSRKSGEAPTEDYSKEFRKSLSAESDKPKNAKMKLLAKSASGSKSITSFFQKKK